MAHETGMAAIDSLDRRLTILEMQILPQDKSSALLSDQMITDLLIQTHAMMSTSLSCRDVINSVLQKLPTINEYLNPSYSENDIEIEAKRQYIMEMCPLLQATANSINDLQKRKQVTDSKNINKVPELIGKLETLAVANLNIHKECKEVTTKILESIQEYNDITMSIKILFAQLEQSMSSIEAALNRKITLEE